MLKSFELFVVDSDVLGGCCFKIEAPFASAIIAA